MTERTTESLDFGRIGRRSIVANFDGGKLTSDAGALHLQQVDQRLGLIPGGVTL